MTIRSIGVSEARRRLPHIVRMIAGEGGRVDVTLRGQPQVSIVRTADVASERASGRRKVLADVLRVEFLVPPGAIVDAIRDLRSRVGRPRGGRARPSSRHRLRARPRA